MKIIPVTLRDIMSLGLGGESWQSFVDHYEEKYNTQTVDGFSFAPVSLNYNFAQLIASVGATPLPTYVDPESEGYEMALRSLQGETGNIPTQKLFYSVNRVVVREQMQLAQKFGQLALNDEMRDVIFALLDEGTDKLIQSFWNALNHQRHRIVSTLQFQITSGNNPRGLNDITITFGAKDYQKDELTTTARWWTDSTHTVATQGSKSDPVQYMKDRVKFIRRDSRVHYQGPLKLELTSDLLDDLLTHTSVLTRIGYQTAPTVETDSAALQVGQNMSDDAKVDTLRRLIGVDAIVPQDTYAYVVKPGKDSDGNPDLVEERIDNFESKNIAFLPTGQIGNIQGVQPLSMGYDSQDVAYSMGNRLLVEQEAVPRTHSINVNGEMAQLCVPSAIRDMFVSTVTA